MYAEIIINSNAKALNRIFDYIVPKSMEDTIKIGARVFVPFGKGKKLEDGFVINLKDVSEIVEKEGKIIVKDIDVNGTENLINLLKEDMKVVTIFLRVPKEELRHRLENRIDKPSEGEIILRLNRFDYEESKIGMYDYVLKNDNLEKTVSVIEEIIRQEMNEENK